jgi:hypothetical protein
MHISWEIVTSILSHIKQYCSAALTPGTAALQQEKDAAKYFSRSGPKWSSIRRRHEKARAKREGLDD